MRPTPLFLATLLITAAALVAPPSARAQTTDGLVGAWAAEEDYFRATILIGRDGQGALEAFFAGEDLSRGAPLSSVTVRGDSLFLAADRVGAAFRGTVSERTIRGMWTQGEMSVPLTLRPVTPAAPRPPQHPVAPLPYTSTDVSVASSTGASLAGTLTLPDGDGPFPGAVLVVGSGPLNRDAEVGGHRTFAVLADHLTRAGVAVLRADKRPDADLDGRTQDAAAALAWLRARPEVDPARVGLIGHSEGALVAPRAIGDGGAFLVLLAAPAAPTGPALVEQNATLAAASGAPEAAVDSIRALMTRVVATAASDADSLAAAAEIRAAFAGQGWTGDALEASVRAHTSPLFRDLARYDPAPALGALGVPTLAVTGSLDVVTPPTQNEGPLRAALAGRGTVRVVEGVNHWLQPATTGLPDEIERIETTIAPSVLNVVVSWIGEHTRPDE